jgi:hypothetical protein
VGEDPLVELARVLTRERFVGALRARYLVFGVQASAEDVDFDTELASFSDRDEDTGVFDAISPLRVDGHPRVHELVKTPGNPFTDRISLGRAPNCDLVLNDPSVSKLHAHFRDQDGVLRVSDVGSQNGTRLNGIALEPHVQTIVQLGDQLQFGALNARLMDAGMLWDAVRAPVR